ncbi:redox-regulated ATPase YchF [Patescibacteria group bacterium]|nr:redox-regulated ATPase YchF [Patescibacteria group bacterium]
MSLSIAIVGLPNVGKSTLFNALLKKAQAEAENRPFTTIEPNIGVVDVPDPRLAKLAELVSPEKIVPATTQFVDIAGLVSGAHKGEGLGNQFLSHIRETDSIALVVRCFDDPKVTHVSGKVNPIDDLRTIALELILADQQTLEKLIYAEQKLAKGGDKEAAERVELMERIAEAFEREQMASRVGFTHEERAALGNIPLITLKPSLVVANVNEEDVAHPSKNDFYQQAETWAEENGAGLVAVSAKIESELSVMEESEAAEFLESLGLEESNLDRFIRAAYQLLGLITFYTAGPKEARAWPIPKDSTAPQAAGAIHTDFQQKFIRADVISYDDYVAAGSESAAAAAGKQRSEGKDYVVQDGDVLLIKHGA